MPTSPPLLIDLAGVARLADVRRPVASVWRTRFASGADPFPAPVSARSGRAFFDGEAVARWLVRTEHGNNPDAVADAAASATPDGFDIADPRHVAAVDALLALHAASGGPSDDRTPAELRRRAADADPDNACLVDEVAHASGDWVEWASRLADAAYSAVQASRLLERRHAAVSRSAGSAGALTPAAEALLVSLVDALRIGDLAELILDGGIDPSLGAELIAQAGDGVEVVVKPSAAGRRVRRRLLCDAVAQPAAMSRGDGPRLHVIRLPSDDVRTAAAMLGVVDDLALGMRDHDRAVVLAPASALLERLSRTGDATRTDVLRTGRVRAIVRLPVGVVSSSWREVLALWVLGREAAKVPLAERFTAVADLTDRPLTPATLADLASDVLAAMGTVRDLRAHAFRFAGLVRTTALLAARGDLMPRGGLPAWERLSHDLAARLDHAHRALGEDAPGGAPAGAPGPRVGAARVEDLLADRHLRLISGTRVAPEELTDTGWIVVGAEELEDPARLGGRRVDPLAFPARHPSAQLTAAGDVIFRTAPTPKAWVDADGSKVVAHPARVLRVRAADPGGLIPELVAADIARAPGGPAAWRRWRMRRVAPAAAAPLRAALAKIATRRAGLDRRIRALDDYSELLADGVVAGVVTLPAPLPDTQ